MQTEQWPKPTIYRESKEDAKHLGAMRESIMGVYPLALVGMLLLAISILGIIKTFQSSVVNTWPQDHRANQPLKAGFGTSQAESMASE